MVANIIKDNRLTGKVYSKYVTGDVSVAYGTSLVTYLTGTDLPAGIYFVEGFINIVSATNTGFYQGFIAYGSDWLDAAGEYVSTGKHYQKDAKAIISHDGSSNIALYLNVGEATTSNNLAVSYPWLKAIRIA